MVTQPADGAELASLIVACGEGDRTAFRALYSKTASRVMGLVCTILRDRALAEDVTQEIYLMLWRKAAQYDPQMGHPMAWISVLARNKALDRLRADRVRGFVIYSDEVPDAAAPGGDDREVTRMAIRKGMAGLRQEYRDILLLAYFQGLTAAEAAETMNIPVGTAKTWLRRGLAVLKEAIE